MCENAKDASIKDLDTIINNAKKAVENFALKMPLKYNDRAFLKKKNIIAFEKEGKELLNIMKGVRNDRLELYKSEHNNWETEIQNTYTKLHSKQINSNKFTAVFISYLNRIMSRLGDDAPEVMTFIRRTKDIIKRMSPNSFIGVLENIKSALEAGKLFKQYTHIKNLDQDKVARALKLPVEKKE